MAFVGPVRKIKIGAPVVTREGESGEVVKGPIRGQFMIEFNDTSRAWIDHDKLTVLLKQPVSKNHAGQRNRERSHA